MPENLELLTSLIIGHKWIKVSVGQLKKPVMPPPAPQSYTFNLESLVSEQVSMSY